MGGEILLLKTKEYLEREGVEIKLFNQGEDSLTDCDIFHTFGSFKECLSLQNKAKSKGEKTALTTICWYDLRSAFYYDYG